MNHLLQFGYVTDSTQSDQDVRSCRAEIRTDDLPDRHSGQVAEWISQPAEVQGIDSTEKPPDLVPDLRDPRLKMGPK